ncbi:hypothetical protein, partial [Stappia sp. ES.058]|uniref:hypothetical protein n=1 Tax=Stappia sp. ES.058 TaxID=1881061 RepID=UPI00087B063C
FPGSKNQNPETRKRTGAIIASYVLEHVRTGRLPIYQLEPHFKETQNIFEENAKYFANLERARPRITEAVDRERVRRAAALLNHQLKAGGHGAGLLASLLQMLNALKPFNFPENKSAERLEAWDRFVKLNTRTGGIYPASRASRHLCQIGEDEIATVLDVFDETDGSLSDEEKGFVSRIATVMKTRIEYFSSEKQKESGNISRDAEAIARLYLVNARLAAAAKGRPDTAWRAVFVTGSKAVTEACYEDPVASREKLPTLTRIHGIEPAIAEGFSGKFVRHVWAYTTEALLETDGQAKFLGWLDGLLGAEAHPTHFTEQRLTEIVRRSHGRPSDKRSGNEEGGTPKSPGTISSSGNGSLQMRSPANASIILASIKPPRRKSRTVLQTN